MYTLYKDRWILDSEGVAIAQRCRGTTNGQWREFIQALKERPEKREEIINVL